MINFPFFCHSCKKMVNGAADPADLLFVAMGRQGLEVTCEECETIYSAIVSKDKISVGAAIERKTDASE